MTVHRSIFWTHLVAGVVVGLVILVMSVTGLLLAFDRQIFALAEQSYETPPVPGAERLKPEAILAKVKETSPGLRPSILTFRSDVAQPVTVSAGRDQVLFLNPYTGAVLGEGSWVRGFLHDVEQLHRNLLLGQRGKVVTGAATLAFLALVLTGVYLWWPRQWTWKNFQAVTLFRPGLKGRAKDWNWHNVIGFWSSPLLLVVILTGVIMSYQWANDLLYRATGNEVPPRREGQGGGEREEGKASNGEKARSAGGPRAEGEAAKGSRGEGRSGEANGGGHGERREGGRRGRGEGREFRPAGLDSAWQQAEKESPGWQTISARLQNSADGTLMFVVDTGDGGRPDLRYNLMLNRQTGEVVKKETFDSYNWGRKLRAWTKPLHTGSLGGWFGRALAAVAAASALLLVWTGLSMSWQRFFPRHRAEAAVVPEVVGTATQPLAESFSQKP